ncbi:ribonuclease HI [Salsuginibacillus halophilus]|uniref:Ribonuclease H n=1 Tax=Salsuginibacillus halophilus TaxID=517424 RepID=A0A2P8HBI0_9BACI|nr:ribonuclease H family protein [Salsuginibacillus halophilus]PSL43577.1 ribonuclease HI [Salsuginibacillus halophilus]
MAKTKYYVVWKGRKPGIYTSWPACEEQVKGYPGAQFKSFQSKAEAEAAYYQTEKQAPAHTGEKNQAGYIEESISVDAGSHGNPGIVEFRGVYTKTGEVVFQSPKIHIGTNNMGEFLAIVEALKWLKEKEEHAWPVYSDSATAMKWVRERKVNSTLKRNADSEDMWQRIDAALQWLKENSWSNPILKWDTKTWGEIKADYDRK